MREASLRTVSEVTTVVVLLPKEFRVHRITPHEQQIGVHPFLALVLGDPRVTHDLGGFMFSPCLHDELVLQHSVLVGQ